MTTTPDNELTAEQQKSLGHALGIALRTGVLGNAADRIAALSQDWELDPGRGDAVEHLRQWAQETDALTIPLAWAGSVEYPEGTELTRPAVIPCTATEGIRVELTVQGDDRIRFASLLDMELRDPYATCSTPGCGSPEDLDTTDVWGWTRLKVAGTDEIYRWYCTPQCVSNALARAGDELAAVDHQAAMDGGL
ncbi:hypothetical protein [Streptomyces sp. NPDC088794]|uniref:hypothetical protein n=1 Tax=Streptomyces sp. NPDC088794 TaxID=3365902 RepID=UPI003800F15D